jgi:hypothetical protein
MSVKVVVDFRDGHYSMMPVEALGWVPEHGVIEIEEDLWKLYDAHVAACGVWHAILGKLDNERYEAEEKAKLDK